MIEIRDEEPGDVSTIRTVNPQAFGEVLDGRVVCQADHEAVRPEQGRRLCSLLVAGAIVAGSVLPDVGAQPGVVLLTQEEARAHWVSSPPAVYPALAQAANVEGVVDVEVEVAPDGGVTRARVLFGAPILDEAALDAARRWRLAPVASGGAPAPVRTGLTFFFVRTPPTQAQVTAAAALNDAVLLCLHRVDQEALAEAERACLEAASVAERTRPSRTAPALASRLLGDALSGLGRHEDAIARYQAARERLGRDADDREIALVDGRLGRSLAAISRLGDAARSYERAQDRLNDVRNRMPRNSPYRAEVTAELQSVLAEYVDLLDKTGDTRRAQRMRDRLASLR